MFFCHNKTVDIHDLLNNYLIYYMIETATKNLAELIIQFESGLLNIFFII